MPPPGPTLSTVASTDGSLAAQTVQQTHPRVGFYQHITPSAAVSTIRATTWHIALLAEADQPGPTLSTDTRDLNLINHDLYADALIILITLWGL
jgi:hypothetical protein